MNEKRETDYLSHHEALYRERRASTRYAGWETGYGNAKATIGRVFRNGHAPSSGLALELGCGAGNITIWLAKQGFAAFGIDISPTAIEWARENAREEEVACTFRLGSVLDPGSFPGERADLVLDGNLIHCIVGDDRTRLFANIRRAMKPGGYLLVRHVLSPVDDRLTEAYRFDPETRLLFHGDTPYRYLPTFEMLQAELETHGFNIASSELTFDLGAERGFQLGMVEVAA